MRATDILVFAPHPDDAELCCGGLLLKAKAAKKRVVVIDITRGEMGTRGTVAIRKQEAAAASKLLGLVARENLGLPDGHLHDDECLRTAMVKCLRNHRPSLLLIPHWEDQHPDHAAVGQAGLYAAWLAGAPKYDSKSSHKVAASDRLPYRPRTVLHYNNRYGIKADLVVDITSVIEDKLRLVKCYGTQFGPGDTRQKKNGAPQTKLSGDHFFDWLRGMHSFYGYQAGVAFGEPYSLKSPLGVRDVDFLI